MDLKKVLEVVELKIAKLEVLTEELVVVLIVIQGR